MEDRQSQDGKSQDWDEYWRSGGDARAALDGEGQKETLAGIWRDVIAAPLKPDARIVDIAAGAGAVFAAMSGAGAQGAGPAAGSTSAFRVALDYSSAALREARAAAGAAGVACLSDALPIADDGGDLVVSQFGIEYAGHAAFGEAARILAPGGRFVAVIHYKGGAIAEECAEQARVIARFEETGVVSALRAALTASFEQSRNAGRANTDDNKEAALQAATAQARNALAEAPATTARTLLARYLDDFKRLSDRRRAFAQADALGWIAAVDETLRAYAGRMTAMTAAAFDEALCARALELFAARDGAGRFEPIRFAPGAPPAAWLFSVERKPR